MVSLRVALICLLLGAVVHSLKLNSISVHGMASHDKTGLVQNSNHQYQQYSEQSVSGQYSEYRHHGRSSHLNGLTSNGQKDLIKQFENIQSKYDHTMGKGAFWLHNDNDGVTDFAQGKSVAYFSIPKQDPNFKPILPDINLPTGSVSYGPVEQDPTTRPQYAIKLLDASLSVPLASIVEAKFEVPELQERKLQSVEELAALADVSLVQKEGKKVKCERKQKSLTVKSKVHS